MKKTYKSAIMGVLIGLLIAGPQLLMNRVYATTYGHYTSELPNPSTINTAVTSGALYYNGSDWQITTLGATQTAGDALSRVPTVVYQSTGTPTITNTITETNIISSVTASAAVGSNSFPAAWLAVGRSIVVETDGYYSTGSSGGTNWTWAIKLGTTTILSSGAVAATPGQLRSPFQTKAVLTIASVGAAGTVNGYFNLTSSSATASFPTTIMQSTYTTLAVPVDLSTTGTGQTSVNPVFTWSVASASITINNVRIRFEN